VAPKEVGVKKYLVRRSASDSRSFRARASGRRAQRRRRASSPHLRPPPAAASALTREKPWTFRVAMGSRLGSGRSPNRDSEEPGSRRPPKSRVSNRLARAPPAQWEQFPGSHKRALSAPAACIAPIRCAPTPPFPLRQRPAAKSNPAPGLSPGSPARSKPCVLRGKPPLTRRPHSHRAGGGPSSRSSRAARRRIFFQG